MTETRKHGGRREGAGRPPLYGTTMRRHVVWLPPDVAERLKALGDGNLSAGIRRQDAERPQ